MLAKMIGALFVEPFEFFVVTRPAFQSIRKILARHDIARNWNNASRSVKKKKKKENIPMG